MKNSFPLMIGTVPRGRRRVLIRSDSVARGGSPLPSRGSLAAPSSAAATPLPHPPAPPGSVSSIDVLEPTWAGSERLLAACGGIKRRGLAPTRGTAAPACVSGGSPAWSGGPCLFWESLAVLGVPPHSGGPCLLWGALPVLGVPARSGGPCLLWGTLPVLGGPACSSGPCLVWASLLVLGVPACSGDPCPFWGSPPIPGVSAHFRGPCPVWGSLPPS